MAEEKTVTNMAMRSAYETVGEIMGHNARDMVFKKVGLSRGLGFRRIGPGTRRSPTPNRSASTTRR